jgi:hypothetical protein
MHRIAIDVPVAAMAAVVMASLVLVAGTAIAPANEEMLSPGAPLEPLFDAWGNCLIGSVTAAPASSVLGQARLCQVGDDLHAILRVGGLVPGGVYTGWLSYTTHPVLCTPSYCEPPAMLPDTPYELMRQIDEGIAASSRTLELGATLPDFSPVSGSRVALLLRHPNGGAGSYAEAVFSIP